MNKKKFCEALRAIQSYQQNLDKFINLVGISFIDSDIATSTFNMQQCLIELIANYDEAVIDDIEWWLYENVEKVWIVDDETIDVSTPEKLYDAMFNLKNNNL
jgi:hypothetical protein